MILKDKRILSKTQNTEEKRAIFFDIDGVLNTKDDWRRKTYSFRPALVQNLCLFAKENHCDLIMISSWRTGFKESFSKENLPHVTQLELEMDKYQIRIKGKTPVYKGKHRDKEIQRYLYDHPYQSYVILDDDKEEYLVPSERNLFLSSNVGFDTSYLKKAKQILLYSST